MPDVLSPPVFRLNLLYHFCRMQLPAVALPRDVFAAHLERAYELYSRKLPEPTTWPSFLETFYPLDFTVAIGCLEGLEHAWEILFASRTGRTDMLLVDALRARASRLYPRNEERQETAVNEFWSGLIVSEREGSLPVLARYDGQRPLTPWLIRVFQNLHLSHLRQQSGVQSLPDDDIALPLPSAARHDYRWHDLFNHIARDWLSSLEEDDLLLLGLRWRYRMSQREAAHFIGVHEGTLTRRTDKLRDRALEMIGQRLVAEGWVGDDLEHFLLTELGALLTDDPRLSADQLANLLRSRGKSAPIPDA